MVETIERRRKGKGELKNRQKNVASLREKTKNISIALIFAMNCNLFFMPSINTDNNVNLFSECQVLYERERIVVCVRIEVCLLSSCDISGYKLIQAVL